MRRILPLAIVLIPIACKTTPPTTSATPQPSNSATPLFGPHGLDMTGMDPSVNACDDFYRFAVGKWRDTHPLPAQYSRYGRFEELAERNRDVLHKILEDDAAMTNAKPGRAEQKVGDFYASCMNETAI